MKIYHTETQADYDALMVELERLGIQTLGKRYWEVYENQTVVIVHAFCRHSKSTRTDTAYGSLGWALQNYPTVPIQKYKAKADEKMRFNKQNIERAFDKFMQGGNDSFADLKERIINLVDEPEKVAVPKFVADYLEERKRDGDRLVTSLYPYQGNSGELIEDWFEEEENNVSFARAWIDGYTIEPDTVTEQRYTVVIADRYLVRLFIGRIDYRFVEFDELWAWEPDAFQLTEAEIKAIDERYWTFAAPVKEVKE